MVYYPSSSARRENNKRNLILYLSKRLVGIDVHELSIGYVMVIKRVLEPIPVRINILWHIPVPWQILQPLYPPLEEIPSDLRPRNGPLLAGERFGIEHEVE